jgi:hypothetical protein
MLYALLYIGAATGATYSRAGGNLSCRLSTPLTDQPRQTVSVYEYRMQAQLWHQVPMLLASARIKLLGCPACSLFRWLTPMLSDCSCYVVARRPPDYEPDCVLSDSIMLLKKVNVSCHPCVVAIVI